MMTADLHIFILFGVLLNGVTASQCPGVIPEHCLELSTRHLAAPGRITASKFFTFCREANEDIALTRECLDNAVADHCPVKVTFLRQLNAAQRLCKAAKECNGVESKFAKIQETCVEDLQRALAAGTDICSTLQTELRCVTDQLEQCPALVTSIKQQYDQVFHQSSLVCDSASIASLHSRVNSHRISRRQTGCSQAARAILTCSRRYLDAILNRPTDVVYVCSTTRDYVRNCVGANTRSCPELRRKLMSRLTGRPGRTERLKRQCGDDIFNMDGDGRPKNKETSTLPKNKDTSSMYSMITDGSYKHTTVRPTNTASSYGKVKYIGLFGMLLAMLKLL